MTWLLNRLFDHQHQSTPRFAFQGTINWMRALAILVEEGEFDHGSLRDFYRPVQRRQPNEELDTLAFECMLMSMHNVASLNAFQESDDSYSFVRSAIVSWYYAIYYASKSMIAAATGSDPQSHTKIGRIWQTDIAPRGLVVAPFDYNFTDLTPASIEQNIAALRGNNTHDLNTTPENLEQAIGAVISYLKGTAEYMKGRLEEKIKNSSPFRNQGFANFRTKAARELRDRELSNGHVNILVQAFRYRGKANYRDAIYLSYGDDNSAALQTFIIDLAFVASAFALMVSRYLFKRVIHRNWGNFVQDVNQNARFSLPFELDEI